MNTVLTPICHFCPAEAVKLDSREHWCCRTCFDKLIAAEDTDQDKIEDESYEDGVWEDGSPRLVRKSDGALWLSCERCSGEGAYDQSDSDPSDWGEDCCSDDPDTIYTCSDCQGECGQWVLFKEAPGV